MDRVEHTAAPRQIKPTDVGVPTLPPGSLPRVHAPCLGAFAFNALPRRMRPDCRRQVDNP